MSKDKMREEFEKWSIENCVFTDGDISYGTSEVNTGWKIWQAACSNKNTELANEKAAREKADTDLRAAKAQIAMKDEALKEAEAFAENYLCTGSKEEDVCIKEHLCIIRPALSTTSETTEAFLNEVRAQVYDDEHTHYCANGWDLTAAMRFKNKAAALRAKNGG